MLVDDRPILCFDIGGTSVKSGLFSPDDYRFKYLDAASTTPFTDKKKFENFLVETIHSYDNAISALAFACTGGITRDYKVVAWRPFQFIKRLDFQKIGSLTQWQVIALNDVSAAAYCELSSSRNAPKNFLFLAIGTGIGGGVVLDGQLVEGELGFAGEFGIGKIYDSRERYYYSIEDLCSGRAIALNLSLSIPELKTEKLQRLWQAQADEFPYFVLAVQNAVNLLDISTVVMGGGITELLFPFYKRELEKKVRGLSGKPIKVRKARYGNKAGMIGVGYYAKDKLLIKED